MEYDLDIDAIGLLCPLPVLRLRKRLEGMEAGQIARLRASDAVAHIDVPHFCEEQGHEFLGSEDLTEGSAFFVRKSGK